MKKKTSGGPSVSIKSVGRKHKAPAVGPSRTRQYVERDVTFLYGENVVIPPDDEDMVASLPNVETTEIRTSIERSEIGVNREVPAIGLTRVEHGVKKIDAPPSKEGVVRKKRKAAVVIVEGEPDRVKRSLNTVIRTAVPLSFVPPVLDTVREPTLPIPLLDQKMHLSNEVSNVSADGGLQQRSDRKGKSLADVGTSAPVESDEASIPYVIFVGEGVGSRGDDLAQSTSL
ncbi:hypothetical protein ACOSQ3_013691 [Xanthoceras sorbifolium]